MKTIELMAEHSHEEVVFCYDKDAGLRAIIAIHDTTLGPSLGGTRMWPYKTEEEALQWLKEYGLYNDASAMKSIQFIRTYRTYVINYNYGLDLVRKYIEDRAGNDPSKRWEVFSKLLSNQVRINELIGVN